MNGYICIWNNIKVEVYADTLYSAKTIAVTEIQKKAGRKKVKICDVRAYLAEKEGQQVVHSPDL